MKLLHILVLSCFLPLAAAAQDTPTPVFGPVDAAEVTLEQFLWLKRPIVVFADTPNDPAFQRQMQRINADNTSTPSSTASIMMRIPAWMQVTSARTRPNAASA